MGARLLEHAGLHAAKERVSRMSIMVTEGDGGAYALFSRAGYALVDRHPFAAFPGSGERGDWVLMIKDIGKSDAAGDP